MEGVGGVDALIPPPQKWKKKSSSQPYDRNICSDGGFLGWVEVAPGRKKKIAALFSFPGAGMKAASFSSDAGLKEVRFSPQKTRMKYFFWQE